MLEDALAEASLSLRTPGPLSPHCRPKRFSTSWPWNEPLCIEGAQTPRCLQGPSLPPSGSSHPEMPCMQGQLPKRYLALRCVMCPRILNKLNTGLSNTKRAQVRDVGPSVRDPAGWQSCSEESSRGSEGREGQNMTPGLVRGYGMTGSHHIGFAPLPPPPTAPPPSLHLPRS